MNIVCYRPAGSTLSTISSYSSTCFCLFWEKIWERFPLVRKTFNPCCSWSGKIATAKAKQKIEPVSYSFPQVGAAPINGPCKTNRVLVKMVERWKMVEFAPDLGSTTRTWDCHQHLELSKSGLGENIWQVCECISGRWARKLEKRRLWPRAGNDVKKVVSNLHFCRPSHQASVKAVKHHLRSPWTPCQPPREHPHPPPCSAPSSTYQ